MCHNVFKGDSYLKFNIITADCPWTYSNKKNNNPKMGGITYDVMSNEDICKIPVGDLADKDCLLFMWATMPKLPEALEVMKAWGFKYTTCPIVWVKLNPKGSITKDGKDITLVRGVYSGMGHYTNGNAEILLMGKKGTPKRFEKNVKQIQLHARGKHSEKPNEVYDEIVRFAGDLPRVELFARKGRVGWTALGGDISGNDITEDIKRIIKI